ncbi:MAG TPA: hypothetical protein VF214_09115, partial [Edaphobacter sp.]
AVLLFSLSILPLNATAQAAPTTTAAPESFPRILNAAEATPLLPPAVFFRGQSASTQTRNSAGVQFAKDALLLATLVDTSGYSSSIQEKYQAYLITEVPIQFDGHRLPPGAYGFGFIAEDNFIVMDIGGHDLFRVPSTRDATLRRPTPLQILNSPTSPQHFRLYAGRNFVEFTSAESH